MTGNISALFVNVNKPGCLFSETRTTRLRVMRFGERLRIAREARGLKQAGLSEISRVSQSLISQLENSLTATGSEYTARLARALNVSVDWLADEIGTMEPQTYSTTDPKVIAVCRIMEAMPEYGKDAAVKDVAEVAQLIAKTKANGTDG